MEWNTIFLKSVEKFIKEQSNTVRASILKHIFVFVHVIVKNTQKTPREDIDISIKRMKDFVTTPPTIP